MNPGPSSPAGANNFGALRLFFAALVVFAHVPEALDGDRHREPLTWLSGGRLSCGDLAVDAFFLISGYLIPHSYLRSGSIAGYLHKRVLRIFPGFVAAYLVTVLVAAPLAGGDLRSALVPGQLAEHLARIVLLHGPFVKGSFVGQHYPALNVSVWTIPYEFNAYLLVIVLGLSGMLRHRVGLPLLALALLVLGTTGLQPGIELPPTLAKIIGTPQDNARLLGMFCAGAVFRLHADRIRLDHRGALVAAGALLLALGQPRWAELALAPLGCYLIFWFALKVRSRRLSRIGSGTDLSYGLYLYAWPVQNLLIRHLPGASPWMLVPLTLAIAAGLGWLSWHLVELPASRWRSRGTLAAVPA